MHYYFLLFVLVISVAAATGERTTITLRNGKTFTGSIVDENANFIILNSSGTNVRILK